MTARGQARVKASAQNDAALNEKVVSYVREKYAVPDNVKITATPFVTSNFSGFLTSTITTDDGKQQKTTNVFLTNDRRFLIVGFLYALGTDVKGEILQHIRQQFKIPDGTNLDLGPFHNSAFPNFQATTMAADNGKVKQSQDFYVTKDNRILVVGDLPRFGRGPPARGVANHRNQKPALRRTGARSGYTCGIRGPRMPRVRAAP